MPDVYIQDDIKITVRIGAEQVTSAGVERFAVNGNGTKDITIPELEDKLLLELKVDGIGRNFDADIQPKDCDYTPGSDTIHFYSDIDPESVITGLYK